MATAAAWRSVTGLLAVLSGAPADAAESAATIQGPGTTLQAFGAVPVLLESHPPRFPVAARESGHEDGSALLLVAVDEQGRARDAVTLQATHRAFGDSAAEAVSRWVFAPGKSETLPRRELLDFEFRSKGTITVLSHSEGARESVVPANREHAVRTVSWTEIEPPPQRTGGSMPRLGEAARARLAGRSILASYVIDTDGSVHVPVVDATTDPEAAAAVLDALRGWRFAPVVQDGAPVVVQAERAFQVGGARP